MRRINSEFYQKNGVDGVIVSSRENKYYLAGLYSSRGYVLSCHDEMEVLVDGRYYAEMKHRYPQENIILCSDHTAMVHEINAFIRRGRISKVGLEGNYLTYQAYQKLADEIDCEAVSVDLDGLRKIKDSFEIESMRKACRIACDSLQEILPAIHAGMREKEVENLLVFSMKKNGAQKESFDVIVASGLHGAYPHAKASDRIIQENELITIDYGCRVNEYCSDITRTICVGHCSEALHRIYDTVLSAHDAALKAIRPGALCGDVDAAARKVIEEAGYGKHFPHNLGHSIGIDDHEEPGFAPGSQEILFPGMVLSDEPGIYVEGLGGVRIEDDVLVTEEGCEMLSDFERKLIEL
ncbi:MAG: aminopeptidase P family protein [Solobacterium sp.]|jgi:Xaa-Pro aminopeptidase/Xaa-Pro dipeptidase|nr:aminopeptidase P family protein [Solobacterium sp.]MCH4048375.1 aminopeptidase P family protein [Solobacterium sp.]MCH4074773.1 aminopeptidase P family protein [Solobacterium sp.]MCI1314781.1 aminopeptidase P family protein [Solobacterium sp.]MCI1408623.1 aminopeptidase P family protein [Solobacterium sp.]